MQIKGFDKIVSNPKIDLDSEVLTLKKGYSDSDLKLFMHLIDTFKSKGFLPCYAIEHPSGPLVYQIKE